MARVDQVRHAVNPEPPIETITITLTGNEARTLVTVGEFIGGDPSTTVRGHVDHICQALRKAGVKPFSSTTWVFYGTAPKETNSFNAGSVYAKPCPAEYLK